VVVEAGTTTIIMEEEAVPRLDGEVEDFIEDEGVAVVGAEVRVQTEDQHQMIVSWTSVPQSTVTNSADKLLLILDGGIPEVAVVV
jgi:hypothetical protein